MKKIFSTIILMLILSICFAITGTVRAASSTYGKVEAITENSEKAEVTGADTQEAVVTYQEKEVKWYAADRTIGRDVDGFWIGIKVNAPEGMSNEDLQKAKFRRNGEERSFWSLKDSKTEPHFIGLWKRIDKETLKDKTETITIAEYEFDWKGDGDYEQKIKINIKPDGITLDDDEVVFVKVGTTNFTFKKGNTLNQLSETELEMLKELMTPEEGYKFVGIFDKATGKEVTLEQAISEDMELEVKFEKLQEDTQASEENSEVEKSSEKDNTPATGSKSILLFATVTGIILLAGIVAIKNK